MENKLAVFIGKSGLEESKAKVLIQQFSDYYTIAEEWKQKADAIKVTSIKQTTEMKMAREARLFIREKRIAIEKTRKALKEESLRESQAIDKIAKMLTGLLTPIETNLEQKEKFAEIQAAKLKESIKNMRVQELTPYMEFVPVNVDLLNMEDVDYQKLLTNAIKLHADKLKEDRLAEEAKLAEIKEKEALKSKVEELSQQNATLEAKLEEKPSSDVIPPLPVDNANLSGKNDKQKLISIAVLLDEYRTSINPKLETEEGKKILAGTKELLNKVSLFIRDKSSKL